MPLSEDAPGSAENARQLAAACQFAYFPADQGVASFQSELGLAAELISVDNTQAYVATDDANIVVAFRGSEGPTSIDGLKDWFLTNALNLLIVPEGPLSTEFAAAGVGAKFHQGFVGAIGEIWPALLPKVEAQVAAKDRAVWVTGHSLGGALALLGAWLLKRKFVNVSEIATFGAPMVGNRIVSEAFNREFGGKIFRYVNAPDPVPLLPMMSLVANDFAHCDKLVPLGDASGSNDLLDYLKQMGGQTADGLLGGQIGETVWGGLKGRIAAHLLNDYRKLL
jgi:triacylglycerol lipase